MSDKKDKKKFNDTKFGKFLKDKVKPVAGDIIEVVGDVTGIDAIEKVGELLNSKKEDSEQMKTLAMEFEKYKLEWQLEVMKVETDLYRAEMEDRDSARKREAEFTKATGGRDWLMSSVVITGLILLVGVVVCLVFIQIPEENQRLADMTFGAVMSIGASIFSYYVGSSKNSSFKDQTIHKAISNGK
jgi:hypothetical protein